MSNEIRDPRRDPVPGDVLLVRDRIRTVTSTTRVSVFYTVEYLCPEEDRRQSALTKGKPTRCRQMDWRRRSLDPDVSVLIDVRKIL